MKYSVSNWVFGKEDLEVSFERLRKFSYHGIELRGEPQLYRVSEIKRLMDKHRIEVSSICGMYPGPEAGELRDLSHPQTSVRKEAVDYVRRILDFAKEVNAPLVIVTPNPVGRVRPLASLKEEWKWAVDSVREVGRYAEKSKVLLAIEPINRYETYLINSVDRALEFMEEIGVAGVKVMADTFHMNIEDASLEGAIRKAGKNLIHMHVTDSNRQAVGRGHIDFKEILRALKEIDYRGSLAMEPLPPLANPYLALRGKISGELLDSSVEECITLLKMYERVIQ